MKLAYIAHPRSFSYDWADSLQIMNMCSAFSDLGVEVTLLIPRRRQEDSFVDADPLRSDTRKFTILRLPCIDLGNSSSRDDFSYRLRQLTFYISARVYVWSHTFDVIYFRDLFAVIFFRHFYYEMHDFPKRSYLLRTLLKRARKIFVTNEWKKKTIAERYPEYAYKVEIARNAASEELVQSENQPRPIKEPAKEKDFLIGYFGSLKAKAIEQGIETVFKALRLLPAAYTLMIVGGEKEDVAYYEAKVQELGLSERVFFREKVPQQEVFEQMATCDALVASFPQNEHYSFYMSPLKIFEYMASGRPIVATALPSIEEILTDGKTALLVHPEDAKALAAALRRLGDDVSLGNKLAQNASRLVTQKYTWRKRAEQILRSMQFTKTKTDAKIHIQGAQ